MTDYLWMFKPDAQALINSGQLSNSNVALNSITFANIFAYYSKIYSVYDDYPGATQLSHLVDYVRYNLPKFQGKDDSILSCVYKYSNHL